jgi:hypothetical protein
MYQEKHKGQAMKFVTAIFQDRWHATIYEMCKIFIDLIDHTSLEITSLPHGDSLSYILSLCT